MNLTMAGNPDHATPADHLATSASAQQHECLPDDASCDEFRAVITPHRSLSARAFRHIMTLALICSVVASLPFVVLGAWPVAGFFGLDLLALYIAFRLSFARARAFEEIVVTSVSLVLRKVSHNGEQAEWRFNPLWTSLLRENDDEFGLLRLSLASKGQIVPVGEALSAQERETFAAALAAALGSARRGVLRR